MIKPIMRDVLFLGQKSVSATAADLAVADDLMDTLRANAGRCVGMAANMIGVKKRIIVFDNGGVMMEMFNPEILSRDGAYDAEEGCLSLDGTRKTVRYRRIYVQWQNRAFQSCRGSFSGFTAQIIQHEIDHLNGIVI